MLLRSDDNKRPNCSASNKQFALLGSTMTKSSEANIGLTSVRKLIMSISKKSGSVKVQNRKEAGCGA